MSSNKSNQMPQIESPTAGPAAADQPRAHLVLSGGGVNCIAFVGALEALEATTGPNLSWASISTCSFGTVIGALRASGMRPARIRTGIEEFDLRRLRTESRLQIARRVLRLLRSPSLFDESPVPVVFDDVSGRSSKTLTLRDLEIPIVAAAVDVAAQRLVVYAADVRPKMTVHDLLKVTTAVPPLFSPVRIDGRDMVDASVSWSAPIWLTGASDEDLPIVVLRTGSRPQRTSRSQSALAWFAASHRAGISSHDTFHLDQMPRVTVYDFESRHAPNARLSRTQRRDLMDRGKAHVEEQLERASAAVVDGGVMSASADWADTNPSAEAAFAGALFRARRTDERTVFISYAREDRAYVADVRAHLRPIVADPTIAVWDDSYLAAGADWNWTIRYAIERAGAAILLVSRDFLRSEYIASHESRLLLERSAQGRTRVFIVRVDDCELPAELGLFHVVNFDRPLADVAAADRGSCLARLARDVENALSGNGSR